MWPSCPSDDLGGFGQASSGQDGGRSQTLSYQVMHVRVQNASMTVDSYQKRRF
jgi:hypothetical protein